MSCRPQNQPTSQTLRNALCESVPRTLHALSMHVRRRPCPSQSHPASTRCTGQYLSHALDAPNFPLPVHCPRWSLARQVSIPRRAPTSTSDAIPCPPLTAIHTRSILVRHLGPRPKLRHKTLTEHRCTERGDLNLRGVVLRHFNCRQKLYTRALSQVLRVYVFKAVWRTSHAYG